MVQRITVLGAGAFGTAVAMVLARNGAKVTLWCHEKFVADQINTERVNDQFFTGEVIDSAIYATCSLQEALESAHYIFEAIPVPYLRAVLEDARPYCYIHQTWIMLSKGIEEHTGAFPTDIVTEIVGLGVKTAVAAGPNFAHELAQGVPSAMVVASKDSHVAFEVAQLLRQASLIVEVSSDLIGVQVCSALKNVITLAVGIARGLGWGENSIAALATKGLQEMAMITSNLQGDPATIYGYAGIGDLLLTAFGLQSRNLKVGMLIGQGMPLANIMQTGIVAEGVLTTKTIHQLAGKNHWKLPFCEQLYAVLYQDTLPKSLSSILR